MATHSRILAWRSPWTEKPGGLCPWGRKRVRHNLVTKQNHAKNTFKSKGYFFTSIVAFKIAF